MEWHKTHHQPQTGVKRPNLQQKPLQINVTPTRHRRQKHPRMYDPEPGYPLGINRAPRRPANECIPQTDEIDASGIHGSEYTCDVEGRSGDHNHHVYVKLSKFSRRGAFLPLLLQKCWVKPIRPKKGSNDTLYDAIERYLRYMEAKGKPAYKTGERPPLKREEQRLLRDNTCGQILHKIKTG